MHKVNCAALMALVLGCSEPSNGGVQPGLDAGVSPADQRTHLAPDGAGQPDAEEPALDYERAAEYSAGYGGGSMLVQISGEIVFETYDNGANADTAFHLHSATKGFWAAACAAAIEDGLLEGFDQVVADTITEWRDSKAHPNKDQIRLRHLLELTSGLSQDVDQIQGLDALAEDIYRYVVDSLRLNWMPGETFQYGPSHFYAFGELLSRRLAQAERNRDPLVFLRQRVLDPIGVQVADWVRDPAGNPHIPNGAFLTARNWVKYGQFLLENGRHNGQPLIAGTLMQAMRTPGRVNVGHGGFLWLNSVGGHGVTPSQVTPPGSAGGFIYNHGHPDMFAALGAGKNRMYIFPSLQMVVLRQSHQATVPSDYEFSDHQFLALLLRTADEN